MADKMVKLPKGMTLHIGGQKYGGDKEIPAALVQPRIMEKIKKAEKKAAEKVAAEAAKETTKTETDKA